MADSQAQTTDLMKLFTMSFGLAYFICLISYDLWTSLKSKPHTRWIPAKTFILTALTIQVLTYLDYKNISISDDADVDEYAKLLASQSVIDSGRLVICVFIGYMLPAMASPESAADWGDISALAVSLFTAITAELYYVHKVNKNVAKPPGFTKYELWFVFSGIGLLVCTVMLILFLVAAILAGETVRAMFTQRISSSSSLAENNEDKVMTWWVLCRVGHPQYVMARSILSSSTGLVVTVCIIFSVVKGTILTTTDIVYHDDNWDWLRQTTFVLQCTFVLVGWAVILLRWLSSVFYFGTFSCRNVHKRCSVEDYWTRSIRDRIHMYEIHQWRFAQLQHNHPIFKAIVVWFQAKLKFLLYFLLALQTFLVFFSKCCWFITEIIFVGFRCVRENKKDEQYSKYEKALELLCMPGEVPQSLWSANKKAFRQAQDCLKDRLNECESTSNQSTAYHFHPIQGDQKFVDQLEHLPLIVEYFPALGKNCWKITAVSLLKIITMVSPNQEKSEECVEAYKQAWELMTFPDEVVDDPISVAADKEFRRLKPRETSKDKQLPASEILQKLLKEAKETLQAQKMPMQENDNVHAELLDSKDWDVIAPSYNMYIVSDHIRKSTDLNGSTLVDELVSFLGDVIYDCVNKFLEALENSCSKWAVEFEEEKIWEAIHLAGKAKTLLQNGAILQKPKNNKSCCCCCC